MGYYSSLYGTIHGVNIDMLEEDQAREMLYDAFEDYDLDRTNNSIHISSNSKHYDQWMHPAYNTLANAITDPRGWGELEYSGEETGDLARIDFGPGEWTEVRPNIVWPDNHFYESRPPQQPREQEFTMLKQTD